MFAHVVWLCEQNSCSQLKSTCDYILTFDPCEIRHLHADSITTLCQVVLFSQNQSENENMSDLGGYIKQTIKPPLDQC